ncbi:MAG: hypothetical protein KGI29_01040 [Pseudomonadota bacterium]|nr:hypothetical protein [Pseudomonadota bacterium]MDE3037046.1 hypothetical protein [Pseudomonadota bacterium]
MIAPFFFLILLAGLGIAAAWMAEHPGAVTITWLDWRIDTSAAVLLAAAALLLCAWTLLTWILRTPKNAVEARRSKHYRKGLAELTYGIAALAATDMQGAQAHMKKAEKHLGKIPLTLLLSAQIARSRGDEAGTRALLTQMLDHEETEYLAARSLSDAASKQLLLPQALAMAKRAYALNPGAKNAIASIVSLHVRLSQWQEADMALDQARRKGHLGHQELRRLRGIVRIQQGLAWLAAGRNEAALAAARAGIKDMPHFAPAVTLLARAFAACGQAKKALAIISGAWKRAPHPQLGAALRDIIALQPRAGQAKLTDQFRAIYTQKPPEPAWQCRACGHNTGEWSAHCPACHGFDTLT